MKFLFQWHRAWRQQCSSSQSISRRCSRRRGLWRIGTRRPRRQGSRQWNACGHTTRLQRLWPRHGARPGSSIYCPSATVVRRVARAEYARKPENCHDANIIVASGTGSCRRYKCDDKVIMTTTIFSVTQSWRLWQNSATLIHHPHLTDCPQGQLYWECLL